MRILYLDVNAQYLLPTNNQLPEVVARASTETINFGPGYQPLDVLEKGLSAFIKDNGPFDLIAIAPHILHANQANRNKHLHFIKTYFAYRFPTHHLETLFKTAENLEDITHIPRVALLTNSDFYDFTDQNIINIKTRSDAAIALGKEHWQPMQSMTTLDKEPYVQKRISDRWYNYLQDNNHKIASLTHWVSADEFVHTPHALRRRDWVVPGMNYYARTTAAHILKDNNLNPDIGMPLARTYARLKRLKIIPRDIRLMQILLNARFRERMGQARFSYNCGLALDMPIRKFFEIPAAGCTLITRPFRGGEAMGFTDGETCIHAEPETILEVHNQLIKDPTQAQKIAKRGQEMVRELHDISARASHYQLVFEAVANHHFHGAFWKDGNFRLAPSPDDGKKAQ